MLSSPQYTQDRDHVAYVAPKDPVTALKIAQGISNPWFRCQALAFVALHSADIQQKNCLLEESFQAALETQEPNRIVNVSSWPLKVLCLSGQHTRLQAEVDRLLEIIRQ
jgi:hypothetical protein